MTRLLAMLFLGLMLLAACSGESEPAASEPRADQQDAGPPGPGSAEAEAEPAATPAADAERGVPTPVAEAEPDVAVPDPDAAPAVPPTPATPTTPPGEEASAERPAPPTAADFAELPLRVVDVASGEEIAFPVSRGPYDWSPDGRTIAVTADGRALFLVDIEGGEARLVGEVWAQTDEIRDVDWSPDGSRIAVATAAGTFLVAPDGDVLGMLARRSDLARWSGDGAVLAIGNGRRTSFWAGEELGSTTCGFFRQWLTGGRVVLQGVGGPCTAAGEGAIVRPMFDEPGIKGFYPEFRRLPRAIIHVFDPVRMADATAPEIIVIVPVDPGLQVWVAPGGDRLTYPVRTGPHDRTVRPPVTAPSVIRIRDLRSGDLIATVGEGTEALGFYGSPFSPDGELLAISGSGCGREAFLTFATADGSVVSRTAGFALDVAWSPDGTGVLYQNYGSGGLWLQRPDEATEPRLLGESPGGDVSWSPDG